MSALPQLCIVLMFEITSNFAHYIAKIKRLSRAFLCVLSV